MYRVLVVLSFALLAACSPNEVPSEHLVERQGVFYEINSQTPFTGRSVSYHKNGQLESTVNWKDGKKDGLKRVVTSGPNIFAAKKSSVPFKWAMVIPLSITSPST